MLAKIQWNSANQCLTPIYSVNPLNATGANIHQVLMLTETYGIEWVKIYQYMLDPIHNAHDKITDCEWWHWNLAVFVDEIYADCLAVRVWDCSLSVASCHKVVYKCHLSCELDYIVDGVSTTIEWGRCINVDNQHRDYLHLHNVALTEKLWLFYKITLILETHGTFCTVVEPKWRTK